jgi:Raf kinase inhibitor-like YbhB/YbcL family protein
MRIQLVALFIAASGLPGVAQPPEKSLVVTSSQFENNGTLPIDLTCDGGGAMPQLTWSGAPDGTKSYAVSVLDTDADTPKGNFVHWVVYSIPANVTAITGVPGETAAQADPASAWRPACPPPGKAHHYVFGVYALDATLRDQPHATAVELGKAIQNHVLAKGEITATYERTGEAPK